MARVTLPPLSYVVSALPLLDGTDGDIRWAKDELRLVSAASRAAALMIPQPATVAPVQLRDGMQRLARAPWRPLGGTVDAWVYWDAPSSTWKAL